MQEQLRGDDKWRQMEYFRVSKKCLSHLKKSKRKSVLKKMFQMNQLQDTFNPKFPESILDAYFKNKQFPVSAQVQAKEVEEVKEYDPDQFDQRVRCEECKEIVLVIGFQTQCPSCGLIGENPDFLANTGYFNRCSYTIKTLEEKEAELKFNYAKLTSDCTELLSSLGLKQEVIEELLTSAVTNLKKLEKTNVTVLTKLFAAVLYEVQSEMKLGIPKKTIYAHFEVNVNNHCQYLKKASQIKMQFAELPEDNQIVLKSSLDTYDMYLVLFQKLKKHSSSANMIVINLICDYLELEETLPRFKNTTNSVVVEYPQISSLWNRLWSEGQKKWKKLIEIGLPSSLVEMRSKQFQFYIDFTQSPPFFGQQSKTTKNIMNTAINLKVRGPISKKIYTLKFFSKGKVVIAGITNSYQQSEVSNIMFKLFQTIFESLGVSYRPPSVIKTTLSNFSTCIPIPEESLIDIAQAYLNIKKKLDEIQILCRENNTLVVNHKIINHRIYLDLAIKKNQMPFYIPNSESTSNLKSHRSVQFILTQKGNLIIQGADDSLVNTIHVRRIFGLIFAQFIAPFIYRPNSNSAANDSDVDQEELTQLVNSLESHFQNEEQTQLVEHIWLYFQKNHILADHSLRIKTRFFKQILDVSRLVILNEQDVHHAKHEFSPLSYIIQAEHPFKVPTKTPTKTGNLDICFKCVMKCRKDNKIQNPLFQQFLKDVLRVPEIEPQFAQILSNIIHAITKTTKKPKKASF